MPVVGFKMDGVWKELCYCLLDGCAVLCCVLSVEEELMSNFRNISENHLLGYVSIFMISILNEFINLRLAVLLRLPNSPPEHDCSSPVCLFRPVKPTE